MKEKINQFKKNVFERLLNLEFQKNLKDNPSSENEAKRHEWVHSILSELEEGQTILDAGAGEKQYQKYCEHLKYFSQDVKNYSGEGNGDALQTGSWEYGDIDYVCDIEKLDIADNHFDNVLCTEVLEHVKDPRKALDELVRVLKPGGRLILTAPFCALTHFAPYFYSTGFSEYFFRETLGNRLKNLKIVKNGNFFSYLIQELNRVEYILSQYCDGADGSKAEKLIVLLNKEFQKFKDLDQGSSDLLCYGLFVVGEKIE